MNKQRDRLSLLRTITLWVGLMVIVGIITQSIVAKEMLLAKGNTILLELAPVDPRSLIQGDYMRLRYQLAEHVPQGTIDLSTDGYLVVALDANHVASYIRLEVPGQALAAGEKRIKYRRRGGNVSFGSNAYFFQEGSADKFVAARYGELRVNQAGEAVLVNLVDTNHQRLGPAWAD